jgi:Tfp pilus assembly protein FimT
MSGAAHELAASLALARAEAVHGRIDVLVEPLNPDLGWVSGWRVHAGEQEFSRSPAVSPRLVQDARSTGSFKNSTKGGAFFAFSSKGFALRISSRFNAMPTGKLWWSSPDTPQERVVIVDWVGRVRVCDPLQDKKHCGD